MKYKNTFYCLSGMLILACSSCAGKGISKNDVELFMGEFFEKTKQNDFSLIASYYSEDAFENTSREEWEVLYNRIHEVLGTLISVELESWSMRTVLATSGSGRHFAFTYKNTYENGIAEEKISIFAPRGKDEMLINSHFYSSEAFAGM